VRRLSAIGISAFAFAVHPHDREAKLACWHNIMKITLRRMKNSLAARAPDRFFEMRVAGFVGFDLLSRHNQIKINREVAASCCEQIVIGVR
jgi:hypothetical protein